MQRLNKDNNALRGTHHPGTVVNKASAFLNPVTHLASKTQEFSKKQN